jgi:catechol 2,3-dioxygenase-like lactoylglutathione lyase family enzyme
MSASLAEEIFGPLPKPLHLRISVSNLETSVEWYSESLGFSLTKQVDLSENPFFSINAMPSGRHAQPFLSGAAAPSGVD